MHKTLSRHLAILVIVCCLASFSLYAYLGTFTRYLADDYCYAAKAKTQGLTVAILDWYLNWQGRFLIISTQSVLGLLGPATAAAMPLILFTLWLALTFRALRRFDKALALFQSPLVALMLALLIITTTLSAAPSLFQSFYWQSGMLVYTLPLILMSGYLGSLGTYASRQNNTRPIIPLIISSILLFLAAGTSEVVVVLQITALTLAIFLSAAFGSQTIKRRIPPALAIGLVGAIVGGAILILAPGNTVRIDANSGATEPMKLIFITVQSMAWFLSAVLTRGLAHLALLAICAGWAAFSLHTPASLLALKATPKRLLRLMLGLALVGYIVLLACFVPGAYILAGTPPRAYAIPLFALVWLTLCEGYLAGLALRRTFPQTPQQNRFVIITVVFLLLLGPVKTSLDIFSRNIPIYRAYANAWTARDADIRAATRNDERVLTIPILENPWGIPIIDADPGKTNSCIAAYYNVGQYPTP